MATNGKPPGRELSNLEQFLVTEASQQTSKMFFEFVVSDMMKSKQVLWSALVSAIEGEVKTTKRTKGYVKLFKELHLSDDYEFEQVFRITRKTFRVLLSDLRKGETEEEKAPTEREVLLVLFYLGRSEGAESDWAMLGETFDLDQEDAKKLLWRTCNKIASKLKAKYIQWPSDPQKISDLHACLQRKIKIPRLLGVVGAILLEENQVVLELVVDDSHRIMWCHAQTEVSTPDDLMDASGLRRKLEADTSGSLLLAGHSYSQKGSLLTPFEEPALTRKEASFNLLLEKGQQFFSETAKLISCRFPALAGLRTGGCDGAIDLITTACILHNLCEVEHDMAPVVWR